MADMDQQIVVNIKPTNWFLVWLLHTINSEVQLAFQAIYSQVVKAQSSSLDTSIIATLYKEIKTIFKKVMRYQVADFNLPADLKNNSTREILKNEDKTETTLKKKRKRGEDPSTRNFKQKQGTLDLWGLPEGADFNSIFGDHAKGNALVTKISNFKFNHHQKTGNSFTKTPLCIPFAVGMHCPKGKSCPKNHSLWKAVRREKSQQEDVVAVDSLFTDQYKWQLLSDTALISIIIAPNISSTGVTNYPNSLSPTVVVAQSCRTNIDQSSGVSSKLPRSTVRPSDQPMDQLTDVPSVKPSNQPTAPGVPRGVPSARPSNQPAAPG